MRTTGVSFKRRAGERGLHALSHVLALASLPLGCIYGDDRCDAHQVEARDDQFNHYCTCEPNAIPSAKGFGCTPCGANELVSAGACACADGFVRLSADAPCTEPTAGDVAQGARCASDADCGGSFSFCASPGAEGYCTSAGCTGHGDCASPWYCDDTGSPSFCHTPPSGLGMSCTRNEDCAGQDASFCETQQSHVCIIVGCASAPDICRAELCCDLTALAGLSVCVPESALSAGKCLDGSAPVLP